MFLVAAFGDTVFPVAGVLDVEAEVDVAFGVDGWAVVECVVVASESELVG